MTTTGLIIIGVIALVLCSSSACTTGWCGCARWSRKRSAGSRSSCAAAPTSSPTWSRPSRAMPRTKTRTFEASHRGARGDDRCRQRRSVAATAAADAHDDRPDRAAVRGRRGLSRPQGEPEFPATAGPDWRRSRPSCSRRGAITTPRCATSTPRSRAFPAVLIARPMGFTEEPFYEDPDASIQIRAQGVVRPAGGLTMRRARRARRSLRFVALAAAAACGGRIYFDVSGPTATGRGADPAISTARSRSSKTARSSHRDDPGQRRERSRSTTASIAISRPATTFPTAGG